MTRAQAATILRGLVPAGCNLKALPPEGRAELTAAIDTVLSLAPPKEATNE